MRKLKLDELGRLTPDEFKASEKMPVVLVLDSIRSALNVGSLFRTSDAFALERIILCGITAQPPHREITKTAIGATESVDWSYQDSIVEALANLKEENYTLIGIEQTDTSCQLTEMKWPKGKLAIVLGNEVEGMSNDAIEMLDACIEIPQYGTKHSLNVSVCGGIILWELSKHFRHMKN